MSGPAPGVIALLKWIREATSGLAERDRTLDATTYSRFRIHKHSLTFGFRDTREGRATAEWWGKLFKEVAHPLGLVSVRVTPTTVTLRLTNKSAQYLTYEQVKVTFLGAP